MSQRDKDGLCALLKKRRGGQTETSAVRGGSGRCQRNEKTGIGII